MKYKIYYLTTNYDCLQPKYIGVTKRALSSRLGQHISESKSIGQTKVHNWIKSRINRQQDILIFLIDEVITEPFFWEDFYIGLFKSWGFTLKNMLSSGYSENNVNTKGAMSIEARKKLSMLYSGKTLDRKRVKKSVKNRLREAQKRGYYHSEITKKKISDAQKGKVVSLEERMRLKKIRGNRRTRSTPIMVLNLSTDKVIYKSALIDFCNEYGVHYSNICKVLKGERSHTGGFYFCKIGDFCPIKTPLNRETPEVDNPVLNQ